MPQQFDNTDRGALFLNDKKSEETHPDWTGSINVGGKDYWLNGWVKKARESGKEFFSLSIKPKQPRA